ncbi:MAG: CHAT domain-containing tetratricopeptide repeat protein [Hyphomicrobium sp.]
MRITSIALGLTVLLLAAGPLHADARKDLTGEISALASQARFEDALAKANTLIDLTKAENGGDTAAHAEALSWAAYLHLSVGDVQGATPYFERAVEIYARVLPADHPDLATSLNNLGFDRYRNGRYSESEALYRKALDIRERVLKPNDPGIADTLTNLAELYKVRERAADAIPLLNRALEIRTRSLPADSPLIASSLQNLAGAMELDPNGDKFVAAQKLLERALAIRLKTQRPDHPEVAGAISKLATNLYNQGKYSDAAGRFTEALAIRRKSQPAKHPEIAATLVGLALTMVEQKKYAEAEAQLREAVTIREQVLSPTATTLGQAQRLLARVLNMQGKHDEALDFMRRGTKIALSREQPKAKGREHLTEHLQILAHGPTTEVPADAFDEAFRIGQFAGENEAASAVAQMASRFATQDKTLRGLVHERENLDARMSILEQQLIDDLSRAPDQRKTNTRFDMAELEKRKTEIDAQLKKDFSYYFDLTTPEPLATDATAALLKPDEALISIVSGVDETFVWAITREGKAWHRAPVSWTWLERSVKALRQTLDTEDLKKNISQTGGLMDLGLSYEIYSKLLAPLEPIFKSKAHLLIVPSGPLTSLPFQVLVTKKPGIMQPSLGELGTYKDANWLILDHAISVVPSVPSLKALRTLPRRADAGKPMIGFGNPKLASRISSATEENVPVRLAEAQTRGGDPGLGDMMATRRILSTLEELPGTEDELKHIAKELGAPESDLHFGTAATETAVKATDLSVYNVVYFATHGLIADDIEGLREPALVLTPPDVPDANDDGLLTASEISESLRLNADWVVLAACNTAAESKPGAEALSGLAKSFFHAGARALLVSHWRVDSEAAAKLTTSTFDIKSRNQSMGRAEALRQAMVMQIHATPATVADVWNAYPAFWAAFSVVGEGAQ